MTISSSFNSRFIALSHSAINTLSIDSLDWDSDSDYNYDCDSSLTNDLEVFEHDDDIFSGSFRWTDQTKFVDEHPELIRRKKSFHQLLASKSEETLTTATTRATTTTVDDEKCSTELGERISLLLNSPTNSPRSIMGSFGCNHQVVGRKTLKTGPAATPPDTSVVSLDEEDYAEYVDDMEEYMCRIKA